MSEARDNFGVRFGMWLFLYTEIMFFGGLFILYSVYYHDYYPYFIQGGKELDIFLGSLNTFVLLASSFCVAASIEFLRKGARKAALALLGSLFLFDKGIEWAHKFSHGIYPGSASLAAGPKGLTIFFGLYFTLTGLHALHVLIGSTVLAYCWVLIYRGRITAGNMNWLENTGLFWHLVDIIWIFLFPLFYLIL